MGSGNMDTVGEWLLTLFLLCIPIVNIVMLIVWICSSETSDVKKAFCKAYLVFMVIGIVLYLFMVFMVSAFLI